MNRFASVLADSSTDSAILDKELVYLWHIDLDCWPITQLIETVPLERANTVGVFKCIRAVDFTFEQLKAAASGPCLACANFDGATIMLGQKGGDISKIKEIIPTAVSPINWNSQSLMLINPALKWRNLKTRSRGYSIIITSLQSREGNWRRSVSIWYRVCTFQWTPSSEMDGKQRTCSFCS